MVVGSGDIAKVLKDSEDFIYFASGVSNSLEVDTKQFEREYNALLELSLDKRLVYFSSLSIYDKDTPYTRHKRRMEEVIRSTFDKWCIIRLGNISWGSNPNTIINFLRAKVKNREYVFLKDEFKYICNLNEFHYWIGKIPDFNCEMNITGERIHVIDLYNKIKNE